jgi:uncharacterized protein (TIGR00369 family)
MELQFSISELSSYVDEVFPQVVNQYKILALEPGYAKIVQNISSENLRPGGTVSGPAIFSLVDIGMYILLLAHIGKEPLAVTTNCSIDFLRKPDAGEDMVADCRLLKLGRTLIVGEVLVKASRQEDLLARSSITYFRPKVKS